MFTNANIKVIVCGELFDGDGNLKQKFVKHNLITSAGYDFLSDCMCNATRPAPLKYIAVGTGTTEPTLEDTTMESELLRKLCDYSHVSGNDYFSLGVTLEPGEATGALTEAGILNDSVAGILFDRLVFPVINKEPLDTYRISFTLLFKELETV